MIRFISKEFVKEAVSKGDFTFEGKLNYNLLEAAWAAIHGGYNDMVLPREEAIVAKLKEGFVALGFTMHPHESSRLQGNFFEEALRRDDSFQSLECKVQSAIRAKIAAGIDMDGDDDGPQDAIDGCYAYIMDMYPQYAVYSMNGKLMQVKYSIDKDGDVQLGDPKPVEMSYTPVAQESAGDPCKRVMSGTVTTLKEAAYDSSKGELTITVIKPGFNKSKQRYYPAEALKRSVSIFEGAKMFADHQTESEAKTKPEGSVNNWVANVTKTWAESDGTIKGKAIVIDPQFKAKLDRLNESGMLGEMGVSIRAVGEAKKQVIDGVETTYVESLIAARSVDFVTYAGAGGQVEAMESAVQDDNDVDLISESELRKRRPDLVTLIESNRQIVEGKMKTLEQQLQESQAALAAANTKVTTLEAQVKESNKKTAQAEISKLLTESKLPEIAVNRLKKQFEASETTTGVKEAITSEQDYLKSLGASNTAGTTRKNMGADANGTANESAGNEKKPNLVEAFGLLGLNEAEAKVAAAGK